MDAPWKYAQYSPSSACETSPPSPMDIDQFTTTSSEVVCYTKALSLHPHDPELWLNRSNCLRLLGYPELSLGDAYKARLLVEAGLRDTQSILGNAVRKAYRAKTYALHTTDSAWIKWADAVATPELLALRVQAMLKQLELQIWTELMEGLLAANCCGDYVRMSREAAEKFPDDEVFPSEVLNADAWYVQRAKILRASVDCGEMDEGLMMTTLLNGGVYPTAYPFMEANLLVRDALVFKGIEEDFQRVSTSCMVVRSKIRNLRDEGGESSMTEVDCIGTIGTRDIIAGEILLIDGLDAGSVGVDADPSGCPTCCANPVGNFWNTCCPVLYCSSICAISAADTFHNPICGRDFEYLYSAARHATQTTDFSIDSLLLMRVLASTIKEAADHPLNSKILIRLTPAYGFEEPNLIIFNFQDHIVTPISILQTLDIDIFTNHLYDTWVLHSMRCRLQNNKHGQNLGDWPGTSINGLFSMFNHSCDPTVDWRHDSASSEVTMFATRDCKKGEELCISYIGPIGNDMTVAERRKKLMGWLGMSCRCEKCTAQAGDLKDL